MLGPCVYLFLGELRKQLHLFSGDTRELDWFKQVTSLAIHSGNASNIHLVSDDPIAVDIS